MNIGRLWGAFFGMMCAIFSIQACCAQGVEGEEKFFFSLGYGSLLSEVQNFSIGVGGKTERLITYERRNLAEQLHSSNFRWEENKEPKVRFEKKIHSFIGGFGYTAAGVRVEVEMGTETSKVLQPQGVSNYKLKGGGIPILFVKERVNSLLNYGTEDEQILDGVFAGVSRNKRKMRNLIEAAGNLQSADGKTDTLNELYKGQQTDDILVAMRKYQKEGLLKGSGQGVSKALSDVLETRDITVSKRIVSLDNEEKGYIARALATKIEGADVVELQYLRTTTFAANLCYDYPQIDISVQKFGWRISPFTCVGIGRTSISLSEEYYDTKMSAKIKAGMNFNFTPKLSAYLGTAYSKVLGKTSYEGVPTRGLVDDTTTQNSEKRDTATALFGLERIGVEGGARVFF